MKLDYTFKGAARYNSGRHLLDSGDHYGRHYDQPAITDNQISKFYRYDGSSDVHHGIIETALFLESFYDIDSCLQEQWHEFDEKHGENMSYFESASEFAENIFQSDIDGECIYLKSDHDLPFDQPTFTQVARDNTFNCENELSQCFIYEVYQHVVNEGKDWIYANDEDFVIIFIHTGCDVRSGYSYPLFCKPKNNYNGYIIPVDLNCNYCVVDSNSGFDDHKELDERWQHGYSSYPFGEMDNDVERYFRFSTCADNETYAKLKSGEIVKIACESPIY